MSLLAPWQETLSHLAIKGTLLLAVALVLGLTMRQMSAGRRYIVWLSTVVALAIMPLVMPFLPAWRVLPQVSGPVEMPMLEPVMAPAMDSVLEEQVELNTMSIATKTVSLPVEVQVTAPALKWPYSWQETLIISWLSVDCLLLLRLIFSVWRLRRLEGRCVTGESALIGKLSREIGLRRVPRLVIGPPDAVPMVWGVWKPRLLLPLGFETWPVEKLSAVLLHELAHLKRGDPLALWAAQFMQVMHGINPLAWLTLRQLRADQERACDDTVLRHGVRASDYAQYLLDLSRQTRLAPGLSFCALTVTRSAPVEQRVAAILDPQVQRDGASGRWALGFLSVVSVVVLPLAMLQAAERVADLRGRILDRNGVVLAESTKEKARHYPLKALGAHLIGYTGKTGPKDDTPEGRAAVEKQQNAVLRQGNDVSLSMDARIQSLAIQAMRDGGVTRGAAVVLDPRTGEILAAVSLPSYDPNVFVPSISLENWDVLSANKEHPLLNRAVAEYVPGSAFNPLTGLAGIAAGKGDQKFQCEGSVNYGTLSMQCWIHQQNGGKHGELGMADALVHSCNCFWYQFGNAAGIDQIEGMGRKLGFGASYGITDHEGKGNLPDKSTPSEVANTSIGQGTVLTTPLQMAVLAATVGNAGKVPQPSLLKMDGKTKWRADLTADGLPAAQIEQLREGMRLVVNGESGAGKSAKSDKVIIAGKTGTSQYWRRVDGQRADDKRAWFIGFAPFNKPTLAFVILKEGGKSGGGDCAPIAKRIVEESLALQADGSGEVKAVEATASEAKTMLEVDDIAAPDDGEVEVNKSFMRQSEIAPGTFNRRRTLISAPAVPVKESLPQPNRRRALIPMSFQQAAVGKPVGEALGPFGGSAGLSVGLVAEAVTGVGEDVQLSFDASGLVLEVESSHAFGDVGPVAVAISDEERRQAFFSVEEAGGAGIDERLEVGTAGLLLDDVGGVFFASVGLHGGESGQLTTSGEAEDANAVRLDVPLGSATANGADGAASIGHGVILNGVGAAFLTGEPVFQHKGGDAAITEPLGERVAFMAEAELGMTTARADDDGCAGAFVRSGNVRRDGGVVDVADVATFDLLSLSGAGLRAWSACGPEWQGAWSVGGEGEGLNAKREEENFHVGTIS